MWKRGGRNSAIDRAEAVLSAKKSSTGAAESTRRSVTIAPEHTRFMDGSTKVGSAPANPQILLSDLSDLSSVSLSPRSGADATLPDRVQRTTEFPSKIPRPQSSRERKEDLGGGSRFLKKVPPSSSYSSGATFGKGQTHHMADPSNVPSSRHSSQTAVISRLAQIESRIHSRQQNREQATSEILTQPSQPKVEGRPVSALSSSDEGRQGKRFLKSRAAVTNSVAVGSPKGSSFGTGQPKTADVVVTSAVLKRMPPKVVSGVSLESDEEDMRKLLGECVDSGDESLISPGRPSPVRTMAKELKSRPPPAPSPTSNVPPPRSPTSSTSHGSPFRFTGNVQAHFSPTALSSSPSSPPVSPSPPNSIERADSPQCSSSSLGRNKVLSLEELFPALHPADDPHSDRSAVSSPDFRMNVMTIDNLIPVAFDFTEETQREKREVKHSSPDPTSLLRLGDEEEENEDEWLKSKSDAESEIKTETVDSAREVSESLLEDAEEVMSGAGKETCKSDPRSESVEYDYSSCFTDATSQISEQSRTSESFSKSRDSRSSVSHGRQVSGHHKRRSAPKGRKNVKESAVQAQLDGTRYAWSNGTTVFDPPPAMTYSPLAAYTLSADRVEALSTFSPAAFALNEVLKQHLAMTRRFIESARRLHSSRVQSLEPPNYRYTTLEDTKESIRKQRTSRLMVD